MHNLRHPKCVLSRPDAHEPTSAESYPDKSRPGLKVPESSGVPHLVTYRRRRWAVRKESLHSSV